VNTLQIILQETSFMYLGHL